MAAMYYKCYLSYTNIAAMQKKDGMLYVSQKKSSCGTREDSYEEAVVAHWHISLTNTTNSKKVMKICLCLGMAARLIKLGKV